MADHDSASIVTLHQPRPAGAKTPAERAAAYRARKKAANLRAVIPAPANQLLSHLGQLPAPITLLPREERSPLQADQTSPGARTGWSRTPAQVLLALSALALALTGMVMNGAFAHSLGATETAGWLFLLLGLAADAVALAAPSCAAGLWQARQRVTALAGWSVWLVTFVFAVTASIGFASLNISDVTMARSSRTTPAIVTAQAALADAVTSRDRECRGGVGKFCREREAAVTERRQALDVAMRGVEQAADPQTLASIRIVAWASMGALRPTENDAAMLRLMLLALLPQIGGIVLMIGRAL
jgi:hypothetical protein